MSRKTRKRKLSTEQKTKSKKIARTPAEDSNHSSSDSDSVLSSIRVPSPSNNRSDMKDTSISSQLDLKSQLTYMSCVALSTHYFRNKRRRGEAVDKLRETDTIAQQIEVLSTMIYYNDKYLCKTRGCFRLAQRHSLCKTHCKTKTCVVNGCRRLTFTSYLCAMHYDYAKSNSMTDLLYMIQDARGEICVDPALFPSRSNKMYRLYLIRALHEKTES